MRMKPALLMTCVLAASLGAARAQQPPTAATPPHQIAPPVPERAGNCAPVPPNGTAVTTPEGSTVGCASSEPLGDKLAKSDGVMCPPSGVDPEIRAPTPETGNTPVIPPPGSPGGDPTVRPK
jgi:hypothetical protein